MTHCTTNRNNSRAIAREITEKSSRLPWVGLLSMNEFRFRHYPELDGFRGLAVTLVVVGHALLYSRGIHSQLASLGVLLFFVLSGFLITGVLLNEKAARGRVSLSNFYLRRVLRLAPALLIFLAVVTALIYFRAIVDV